MTQILSLRRQLVAFSVVKNTHRLGLFLGELFSGLSRFVVPIRFSEMFIHVGSSKETPNLQHGCGVVVVMHDVCFSRGHIMPLFRRIHQCTKPSSLYRREFITQRSNSDSKAASVSLCRWVSIHSSGSSD